VADLVTSIEAKLYLQIESDDTDYDTQLAALISYASEAVISHCSQSFVNCTVIDYIGGGGEDLRLSTPQVDSITTITDEDDDDEEVDATTYRFDPDAALVYFKLGGTWGIGRRRWKVTYEAGHDGAPDDVKQATLLLIAARFNRREALTGEKAATYSYTVEKGMPMEVIILLQPYVRMMV